jgi:hypothetical protein
MPSESSQISRTEPGQGAAVIRSASLGMLVVLVVQFGVGMAVNLYVQLPPGGQDIGHALSHGTPGLIIHVVLGLLLIVGSATVVIQAARTRAWPALVASVIALLALLGAAGSGVSFVRTGDNASSLAMALLTGVTMLCYLFVLYTADRRPGPTVTGGPEPGPAP